MTDTDATEESGEERASSEERGSGGNEGEEAFDRESDDARADEKDQV
jgi:hypothetical protein